MSYYLHTIPIRKRSGINIMKTYKYPVINKYRNYTCKKLTVTITFLRVTKIESLVVNVINKK